MFTDILTKDELKNINQMFLAEGEKSFFERLSKVYEKLISRNNEIFLDLAIGTTVMNIFKLNKQNRKLKKGYTEISEFYKWLNDEFRIEKYDYYRNTTSELIDSLVEEKRKIKERETAVLQLFAAWGAIIISIIAIIATLSH
ncbi:hypothetical protein ES705_47437 [subsurface metagenome]